MSMYRMIRKGIEFDAACAFESARAAKQFSNASGLIEAIDEAMRKYDHVTGEEPDIGEIADERGELVRTLMSNVGRFIREGNHVRARNRIMETLQAHLDRSEVGGYRHPRPLNRPLG